MINHHFDDVPRSYLFSEVARRVQTYRQAHPDKSLIHMGIGDVTRPLCQTVVQAMQAASAEQGQAGSFRGYGPEQGYLFLRQAISGYYESMGVQVDPADIFVSDGAKSDLGNLPDLFTTDCRVLIPDPVYPVYRDTNLMAGRQVAYLDATRENGFLPLPDDSLDAQLIYLCSPGNPTGAAYNKAGLARWVEYAREHDAVILYDAAYESFIRSDVPRTIYEIPGAEECAIEVCSLSKTAGFTGTRCGYTVVPRSLVREGMNLHDMWLRRQSTKMNGVAYPVQRAAEAVFTPAGLAGCRESIDAYLRSASVAARVLDELGIWYCGGKDSPYLWMECPRGMDSWSFFDALLENAGVVGTPGSGFGRNGEGYFRLSAFAGEQQAAEAMARMADWLRRG